MRAIQVHRFGGPEALSLHDVPDPEPGPGQVVVAVSAADVIYLDTLLREGWGEDYFTLDLPYVPGGGVAGHVVAVGPGVDPGWSGRHVAAQVSAGYAERAVADVDSLVEVPGSLTSADAAALVHDGVTALELADRAPIAESAWVLVTAAAGGAGSLLVQLARSSGARVVAAARGEDKLALARELGAQVAVDYSVDGWQQQVRDATGGGAQSVFDGAGGALGQAALDATADGGTFVTYGTADGGLADVDRQAAQDRGVRVVAPLEEGRPGDALVGTLLTEALRLAATGRIRPVAGGTYPLARARDAHESLARRTTLGRPLLLV